ncbi:virulence-associated E family protein [Psychrobacillus psychrodurans]|uniref:virulence-associated E family protein n=1 Tax=Psychrobacillus psychrodurans TaxID=126157 RepID=UPI001F4DA014|nr:virulence-associated E family protein [Psychrobacillus psychrodurans]MCK1996813.1 virulence-associated E family protein [Psychrobacillus psychrodurans]
MLPDKTRTQKIKHDATVSVATASSRKSTAWKNQDMLWSDFIAKVQETTRTRETVAEYRKMAKTQQDDIKDVGGFVGGSLKGGRRKVDAVAWRQLLTLDADFIKGDFWDGVTMLFDNACLIYSTHKHTSDAPRLRLIIPLSRPVSPEEYVAVSKKVASQFGIDFFDDTTYQPHRLMYWPSTSSDGEFVFDMQDEAWLNPDDILSMYSDWRDPHEWPESSRQRESRKKMADKQGDPLTKHGMVGAFCRSYSIEEAIQTFLSERYEEAGDGRYTYIEGSTTGGLILYDDGLFAFSHHGTDPVSGLLVNAFDLVRHHLFIDEDDEVKEGTPVNRLPSFKAMSDFVVQDEKVRQDLAIQKIRQASEDFDELDLDEESEVLSLEETDMEWTKRLEYSKSGDLEPVAINIKLILENDPKLKGKIGFDDFSKQPALLGSLPWRKERGGTELWSNSDDEDLRTYLDLVWGIKYGVGKIADVLGGVMRSNTFHPVRDYLNGLEWDGAERIDRMLIDYLGAEESKYVMAVTRKVLVAAVARVMNPGCKFDYMLTLVGPQGLGKSMVWDRLGQEWFSDSMTSIHGKEAYESLHGVWIMEMGELAATRKADVEAIKLFLSKRVDRYRVAYGKRPEEFRRQCIFIGTTNERDFLKDKTGNRRFWPVPVNKKRMKKSWRDLDKETVNQMWAEAVYQYKAGEELFLTGELEAEALSMQESHTEESPWFGLIQDYLDRKLPETWDDMDVAARRMYMDGDFEEIETDGNEIPLVTRERVCALEIWCELFGNDMRKFPMMDRREINDILRRMPGWKAYDSSKSGNLRFGKLYGLQRAFTKI